MSHESWKVYGVDKLTNKISLYVGNDRAKSDRSIGKIRDMGICYTQDPRFKSSSSFHCISHILIDKKDIHLIKLAGYELIEDNIVCVPKIFRLKKRR